MWNFTLHLHDVTQKCSFVESTTEVNLRFALGSVEALAVNKYYWDLGFVTLHAICFNCGVFGGTTVRSEILKLINSIWNKEELPEQWKESLVIPIKKGDKTDCSNYRGISLLLAAYNILVSRLTPHAEEIAEDHQFGFPLNRPTTDREF